MEILNWLVYNSLCIYLWSIITLYALTRGIGIMKILTKLVMINFLIFTYNWVWAGNNQGQLAKNNYNITMCKATKANFCIDQVCQTSEDINCQQTCKQDAEDSCNDMTTNNNSDSQSIDNTKYNKKMCRVVKSNNCIDQICQTSEDINCQEKCQTQAKASCDN